MMSALKRLLSNFVGFVKRNPAFFSGLLLIIAGRALAQSTPTIISEGNNNAQSLGAVADMVKTIQHIAYNWIAPLCGTCLAIYGIYKIAVRETMVGTVALVCGGAMFFVQKILQGLQNIAGGGQ